MIWQYVIRILLIANWWCLFDDVRSSIDGIHKIDEIGSSCEYYFCWSEFLDRSHIFVIHIHEVCQYFVFWICLCPILMFCSCYVTITVMNAFWKTFQGVILVTLYPKARPIIGCHRYIGASLTACMQDLPVLFLYHLLAVLAWG